MRNIGPVELLVLAIVFAVIGAVLGGQRGRPYTGAALGFLLGPLGLLIIVLMRPRRTTPS